MKLTHDERPRTKREADKLRRELARSLRRQDREKLAALRAALKVARKKRRQAMAAAVEFCREGRRLVARRLAARRLAALAELRAAREAEALAARRACQAKKDAVRDKAAPRISKAEAELTEARRSLRELAAVERSTRSRDRERSKRGASAAERRAESDDAVRANLPPDLVPVFNKVRRAIKATARKSRTEAFLQWAEENPGEVVAIQDDNAARELAQLISERDEQERRLRSRKRYRRPAEELAAELDETNDKDKVPF